MSGKTKGLRVALVEDSERIRARLAETIGEIPNVTIAFVAETEGEAVRQLAAEPWDVVILDLQLKSGTGLGVLKAMHDWRKRVKRRRHLSALVPIDTPLTTRALQRDLDDLGPTRGAGHHRARVDRRRLQVDGSDGTAPGGPVE